MSQTSLDARYGRTRRFTRRQRVIGIIAVGAFAIVFAAWLVWAGLLGDAASIETRDNGYTISSDSLVSVQFQVTADADTRLSCAVQALNESFAIVGWRIVHLPASAERTRSFTEDVRTSEQAVTGLIYRCWLA